MSHPNTFPTPEESGNPLSIVDAKEAVRAEMEKHPTWPGVAFVRQLSRTYLDRPETRRRVFKETDWSFTSFDPWHKKYMRKVVSERLTIEGEDDIISIGFDTISLHNKRFLMPGVARMGRLAFKDSEPSVERLYLATADQAVMLEVNEGSEMRTRTMAEMLLSLPDEPVVVPPSRVG